MSSPPLYPESLPLHGDADASQPAETGYPWLFFSWGRSWIIGLFVTLLVIGLGGAFYIWYIHSRHATAPGSIVGLGYGVIGTIFLILAALSYSLRRRTRKRAPGQLNASLHWHAFFAIIGLAMILMHSFGNFNPISGTYALCGMAALTISGLVGRILDRLMPRLIAGEVAKALTVQGEDRITTISQEVQDIVVHNTQKDLPAFTMNGHPQFPIPWDLAYISLESTQEELDRNVPLDRSGVLIPGAQEHISALQDVHAAMQRERFYRYVIRYWRVVHLSLVFLTIGLVTWHLIFATQLLLHPLALAAPQVTPSLPAPTPALTASTLSPGSPLYPRLAPSYAGTVSDLLAKEKTAMFLTQIAQNRGSMRGSFQGLGLVGSLMGTVTPAGQVQFTVKVGAGGEETLAFAGNIKIGGDIVGSFDVLDRNGDQTGESGLWNVAAIS